MVRNWWYEPTNPTSLVSLISRQKLSGIVCRYLQVQSDGRKSGWQIFASVGTARTLPAPTSFGVGVPTRSLYRILALSNLCQTRTSPNQSRVQPDIFLCLDADLGSSVQTIWLYIILSKVQINNDTIKSWVLTLVVLTNNLLLWGSRKSEPVEVPHLQVS